MPLYIVPKDAKHRQKSPYPIWYKTQYCLGGNGCTLNPSCSNTAHQKCTAIYIITVYEGYEDFFHLDIKGLHGPGFSVDIGILPIGSEVGVKVYNGV